jgi:hypothetical protein
MTGCEEARGDTKERGDGRTGLLLYADTGGKAAGYAPEGRIRLDPELAPLERNAISKGEAVDKEEYWGIVPVCLPISAACN